MRLALFCSLVIVAGLAFLFLPPAYVYAQSIFEEANASIETGFFAVFINPLESTFVSFSNGNGFVQSFLAQPAIFPQENDLVSWGNANATIHSMPKDPFSGPPGHFEQLLAKKFKPILYLHEDEKYKPQEIQVALDTADLYKDAVLVQSTPPTLSPDLLASSAASDYKLDLDGDVFIEQSPITGETYKNTVYAHITKDQNHVVLQYWFFYYYNNWEGGPDHEGDWEFIQLVFPVDKSPQEIIEKNISPDEAVYSAHAGGYKENWDAVGKNGDRPKVYVAKGSHANYFKKGICDLTAPRGTGVDEMHPQNDPFEVINSQPILDPIGNAFNWLLFGGRWGENATNSPDSPVRQVVPLTGEKKWFTPIAWSNAKLGGLFPLVANWDDFFLDHCDGDFDGIWNNVDTEPEVFSNSFSAPGPFGRTTDGAIAQRGDRDIKIKDSLTHGAHFNVSKGNQTAIIKLDGIFCSPASTIVVKPNHSLLGIATCLSAELALEEGSADLVASHNGVEVIATVSAGQTVHYDIIDDKLHIETFGAGKIPLTINGKPATIQAGETTSVIEISIDIKPDSDRNRINCKKPKQLIPVSILSTDTFDAGTVDHTTVRFEGASEFHKDKKTGLSKRHGEDDDDDDEDDKDDDKEDLMFHFRLSDTTLTCQSTEGTLVGRTFGGNLFIGTDSIDTKSQ